MKRGQDENGEYWEVADQGIWVGDDGMNAAARWAKKQIKRGQEEATILSGFGKEVLRLTAQDVKFLQDCGIKVE